MENDEEITEDSREILQFFIEHSQVPCHFSNNDENLNVVKDNLKRKFPYHCEIDVYTKHVKWCEEHFGGALYSYNETMDDVIENNNSFKIINKDAVWDFWGNMLMFKNKSDATLFKLTWC